MVKQRDELSSYSVSILFIPCFVNWFTNLASTNALIYITCILLLFCCYMFRRSFHLQGAYTNVATTCSYKIVLKWSRISGCIIIIFILEFIFCCYMFGRSFHLQWAYNNVATTCSNKIVLKWSRISRRIIIIFILEFILQLLWPIPYFTTVTIQDFECNTLRRK
jgi:hypothetical protein